MTIVAYVFLFLVHYLQLMWRVAMADDSKLDHIILEVERLWPPFFGGRRMCTKVSVLSPI